VPRADEEMNFKPGDLVTVIHSMYLFTTSGLEFRLGVCGTLSPGDMALVLQVEPSGPLYLRPLFVLCKGCVGWLPSHWVQ
jgi:hypothetical protein